MGFDTDEFNAYDALKAYDELTFEIPDTYDAVVEYELDIELFDQDDVPNRELVIPPNKLIDPVTNKEPDIIADPVYGNVLDITAPDTYDAVKAYELDTLREDDHFNPVEVLESDTNI